MSRVVVIAILLALAAGCATRPPPAPEPEAAPPIPVTPVPPAPSPPTAEERAALRAERLACERLTVAAVGDIMLGTDFPENHLADDDGESLLQQVAPALREADIAFGNVEGVLMDGGEPVKTCKDPKACYLFRSPARYARLLADAGIDVVSLANNHARDFGEEGRTASMRSLDAAGIRHSGRVGDVASWHHGDVGIAMIAFAPFTNSHPMLDPELAADMVRVLTDANDIIIVSFHGGAEGIDASRVPFTSERYFGEDRGDVVKFARGMIDAGADLVIGHGPHVPRAMELWRGRLVAYSLGNFATYYGISVAGPKGYAPILAATLDGNGHFVEGRIISAIQVRPDGPRLDPAERAYQMIRELSALDFPQGELVFADGGRFTTAGPGESCPQSPANRQP